MTLTGFGLVTQDNAPQYVPFNSTQAPFGCDSCMSRYCPTGLKYLLFLLGCIAPKSMTVRRRDMQSQSFGVTNAQRDDAYNQWFKGLI